MNKTKIEWCDVTLNPVVGCTFNCPYCYAKKLNDRFKFINNWNKPQFYPERLKLLNSEKPRNIFMNSMSDIADWSSTVVEEVFKEIDNNRQHNYLFLTKRPKQLHSEFDRNRNNVWGGVSVSTDKEYRERCNDSFHVFNRYISFEPLHSEINLSLWDDSYRWFIIGSETGNRKEKIIPKKEWVDQIVKFAKRFGVPVFMKDSLISIVGEENMLREFPFKKNNESEEEQ